MKNSKFKHQLYLDVESLGLMGKTKLIQFKLNKSKIFMFRPDKEPKYLRPLKRLLMRRDLVVIIYNAPFDLFKLYKIFGTKERFQCEVLDLANHAKLKHELGKYSFQRSGERAIAKLTDIPEIIAEDIAQYVVRKLSERIPSLIKVKRSIHGTKNKGLKNITFSLEANLRLKTIMKYEGEITQDINDLWPVPKKGEEDKHNPFQQPVHDRIEPECDKILDNPNHLFWKYSEDDIKYLVKLQKILGYPEPDYNDTISHIVGFTKVNGFEIDQKIISDMITDYKKEIEKADELPFDIASSKQKLDYFNSKYPKMGLKNCDKKVLKKLAKLGDKDAIKLENIGTINQQLRQAEKLASTDDLRAHPDFRVLGTATQRMAGSGGFNYQGIGKESPIRKAILCDMAGDFSSLEVGLSAVIYDDKALQSNLDRGLDMHLALGVKVIPYLKQYTYEEAKVIKDEAEDLPEHLQEEKHKKLMKARKQAKFLMFTSIYGGTERAVSDLLGVSFEVAESLLKAFNKEYKDMARYKMEMEKEYCTGDTITWDEDSVSKMKNYCTDFFGYKRSFKFECEVADIFWQLTNNNDIEYKQIFKGLENIKVTRKEFKGEQTLRNAVRSAFMGAALTIQKSVARSATNSIVQSVGAQTTKKLMQYVWDREGRETPISMLQVHDEVITSTRNPTEKYFTNVPKQIQEFIKIMKKDFKYLGMDFKKASCWADRT